MASLRAAGEGRDLRARDPGGDARGVEWCARLVCNPHYELLWDRVKWVFVSKSNGTAHGGS